jgi:uncharacterized protein (TIGR03545 family)
MRWARLVILLVLVAGLVVFDLVFKNRLAERALESALEGVFQAKVEVDDLHLKVLSASVTFDRVAVGDQARPTKNLFELGPAALDLSMAQLLRRKLVIQEMSAERLAWATDRSTPASLEGTQAPADPASGGEGEGVSRSPLGALQLDPEELLEREMAQLRSPAAAEALQASLEEATATWSSRTGELGEKAERTRDAVTAVREIDFAGMKTVEEAREAYKTVEEATPLVQDLAKEAKGSVAELREDRSRLAAATTGFSAAVAQDRQYLRSRVSVPEGGFRGVAAGLARQYLAERLGRFSGLAFRILDYAGRAAAGGEGEPREPPPSRRPGHDVPFAARDYPEFVLERFAFSGDAVAGSGDAYATEARLTGLSNDPDLWGEPAVLEAGLEREGRRLQVSGLYDGRSEATPIYSINSAGRGYRLDLSNLRSLGSLTGSYAFEIDLAIDRDRSLAGEATIRLAELSAANVEDTVGEVVRDALVRAEEVRFDVGFAVGGDGVLDLEIASNVDDAIAGELRRRADELVASYRARLEEELQSRLAPYEERRAELLASLEGYTNRVGAVEDQSSAYTAQLEAKRAEYEQRISQGARDTLRRATDRIKLPGF